MIKLLIVDDSALMRRQLTRCSRPRAISRSARPATAAEAVEENRVFQPDVVTLDINMPEMDGITALSLMMAERPVPVVMVSSLTEKGALATFEALNLGAVDYIAKPGGTISLSIDEIKRRTGGQGARGRPRPACSGRSARGPGAAAARRARQRLRPRRSGRHPSPASRSDGLVLIGVSTGGPRTLEDVLPGLPADFPWPVLVAQHMPASFTRPLPSG